MEYSMSGIGMEYISVSQLGLPLPVTMVGIEAFDYCGQTRHAILHTTKSKCHIQHNRFWRHLSHAQHTVELGCYIFGFQTIKAN